MDNLEFDQAKHQSMQQSIESQDLVGCIDDSSDIASQKNLLGCEMKGNILFAVFAGSGTAVLGAIIWAVVTLLTGYKIGLIAIGVGFMVGLSVRNKGKGRSTVYGVIGALFALLGCVVGDLLASCCITAKMESIPLFDVLKILTPSIIFETLKQNFQPIDLLFYGLAVYEGFRIPTKKP